MKTTMTIEGQQVDATPQEVERWVASGMLVGRCAWTAANQSWLDRCDAVIKYVFSVDDGGEERIYFAYDAMVEVLAVPPGIEWEF